MNSELLSEVLKLKIKTAELVIDCLPPQVGGRAKKLHEEILSAIHSATDRADASENVPSRKIDIS